MLEHIGHLALAALRDHGHAIEGLIHHCIVSSAVATSATPAVNSTLTTTMLRPS